MKVLVSGHRGEKTHGAENTVSAFRRAFDSGVDMMETDVRMTKDGGLILMHDEKVDRTTDGTGLVKDYTFDEIRRLNAAVHSAPQISPEPPASLQELLDLAKNYPGVLLNIEFKDCPVSGNEAFAYECADRICEALLANNVAGRSYINSFSGRILEYVYKKYGRTFRYHGFYPWFILGEMDTDPESFIDVACMQHRYQAADGSVIKYADPMCPKEWFDYLLARGITPLMAPSLKEYSLYDTAISWGSRIVNVDNPEDMLAHLREKGMHE